MYGLKQLWTDLRASLWFVPSLVVLGAVALSLAMIQLDDVLRLSWLDKWSRLFGAGAEGSRGMLTAIATSMITVAGVTFSITMAALAQAAGQYSPLVLRNFMRDRANQLVLGTFGGIFVYCLIVLRSIRGGEDEFIPTLAVTLALVHALIGIGVLLYFIHHMASVLQASSMLAIIAGRTLRSFDTLFPEQLGEDIDEPRTLDCQRGLDSRRWQQIRPRQTGYVQSIDTDTLLSVARDADAVIRFECAIGDFVIEDLAVASIGLQQEPDRSVLDAIRDSFIIGEYRTTEQDAAFGLRQIVDMGVKALSPGINDPTTACACLDYIGAIMVRLASRRVPSSERRVDGKLRIIAAGPTFKDMADLAFDQMRHHARDHVVVLTAIVKAIDRTAVVTASIERNRILLTHLERTELYGSRLLEDDPGRSTFDRCIDDARGRILRAFPRARSPAVETCQGS